MRSLLDLKKPGMKVLIQRADRLGDMILALPVVEQLREWYPQLKIGMLCSPVSELLIKNHPHIQTIHVAKKDEKGQLKNKAELQKSIAAARYDVYIGLWDNSIFAKIAKKAGIGIRIGDAGRDFNRWLYTHRVHQRWRDFTLHQVDLNLSLLTPLLQPFSKVPKTVLYPSQEWEDTVSSFFSKHVNPNKSSVLIFRGTGGSNIDIPIEPMQKFIESLTDFTVIICYGDSDSSDPISKIKGDHIINLNRWVSFEELVSLINHADYYIGPDTGPTHIASFLNKPILLFTPKKNLFPNLWGPLSNCFQILRTDYRCDALCTETCSAMMSCTTTSAEELMDGFQELVTDFLTQTCLTYEQKADRRLKSSVRVLCLYSNLEEKKEAEPAIEASREYGLRVYTGLWRGWRDLKKLIWMVRRFNITVIQGHVPMWVKSIIRFYIGSLKVYVAPIFIDQTLHIYIDPDDCFSMYKKEWER